MLIPYSDGNVVSYLNEHAIVEFVEHKEEGTYLTCNVRSLIFHKFMRYVETNKYFTSKYLKNIQ